MHRLTVRRALGVAVAGALATVALGVATPVPAAAATPGCVVDLADVLGWWRGENTLAAEVGPDLAGSVGFADAHVGRGLLFGSSSDVSTPSLPAAGAFTLEAWIEPERTGFVQTIFSRWTFLEGQSDDAYALLLTEDSLILYTGEASTLGQATVSARAPQLYDGSFHHVAATFGGGEVVLYVDGVAVGSGPGPVGPINPGTSTPFRLGASSGVGRLPYAGIIDEPTVFGRALAADEIGAIFDAGQQGKCPTTKLSPNDGASGDQYGQSVAVDGDVAVVGAPFATQAGSASGSAYVHVRSGASWTQEAELVGSGASANDLFGQSVAIDGDTAVVGAYLDDAVATDSGSAYVFTRSGTTWTQQAVLTAADGSATDWFGSSVQISGDTIVVGAPLDDPAGADSGSAYVFTRSGTTWTQQAKLVAAGGAAGDRFGFSVDVDGDTAVAGAYRDDTSATDTGSAYVFVRSGTAWSQQAQLLASDRAATDWFGYAVAVAGDRVVAGAYRDDDGGSDSGAAYVFTRSGAAWSEQAKLVAAGAAASDAFGSSVDASGDRIVVGVALDDLGAAPDAGSARVFAFDGSAWAEIAALAARDGVSGDDFGTAVAIDGGAVAVGAPFGQGSAMASGVAYLFFLGP